MVATHRAVLIRYTRDGETRRGSGLRIGNRFILTADHCASGSNHRIFIGGKETPAYVHVRSNSQDVDVAILHAPNLEPPLDGLGCAVLDRTVAGDLTGCKALGFPVWKAGPSGQPLLAQVEGQVPTAEGADPGASGASIPSLAFKITNQQIRQPPVPSGDLDQRSSPWAGMSGAVVLTGEGRLDDLIVGVVRGHSLAEGTASLTLTPIAAIATLPPDTAKLFWEALQVPWPSGDCQSYCSLLMHELGLWRSLGSFTSRVLNQIYVPHFLIDKKGEDLSDPTVLEGLLAPAPDSSRVLLIEGNAGSGKTMLLRNWALTMAQSCLRSESKGYAPIYLPLGWIERAYGRKEPWSDSPLELAGRRYPGNATRPSSGQPTIALQEAARDGRVAILLDAADEISEEAFPYFLDWWDRLRLSIGNCPIVLTSRPATRTDGLSLAKKLFLRPFNGQQRDRFFRNWFCEDEEVVSALNAQLKRSFRLQAPDVWGNPLFLAMICLEFETRRTLSASQGRLLDQFVRLLLENWDIERGVRRTQFPIDLKLRVLESVATHFFELHRWSFEEGELFDYVRRFLHKLRNRVRPDNLIEEIVVTSGLLVKDRGGSYQFCHSLLLEYFMARDKALRLEQSQQRIWLKEVFFDDARYEKILEFYNDLKGGR